MGVVLLLLWLHDKLWRDGVGSQFTHVPNTNVGVGICTKLIAKYKPIVGDA